MTKASPPTISVRLLGDASITTPVGTIEPSSEIVFAAALYLILERHETVSRRQLQATLWPEASDRSASHRMRQTLLKLRHLGLPIELQSKGNIAVCCESVSIDYEEFLAARKGLEQSSNEALVMLPGYEPKFSEAYLEWLDGRKAGVNASMTRVMLGIIARHRVKGEWAEVELNASRLLRFQPYNEEATLAMAEAYAMRGGKLDAIRILDRYLSEIGSGPTDLRLSATIMRRRIADRMHPRSEAVIGESPLVGRGAVMEQLGELLELCRTGKGQACFVWGDAGVGKTRLLSEFATFASLGGIQTQRVQCRPNDLHRPLSVFVDLVPGLRAMRGAIGCSPETFGYLDRLTKHKSIRTEIKADETDSEFLYAKVQQSLFDLVDAVSDEACLIVIVEDVHWIDSTSAKVLHDMVVWAREHAILFAFTGRDSPEGLLAHMPDRLTEIHLTPLEPGPSKDVVLGVVRQHGRVIDEQYLDWCVSVAEGNPYFLQELANHWVETRQQHEVPSSLTAVLDDRISRLPADTLQLLQTCTVLDKHSTLDRIEKVLGFEPHRMLKAINELGSAGMLVIDASDAKRAPDRFSSRHDLLSNAALARLAATALAFLHCRAGAILENEIGEDPSAAVLWEAAKHWQMAGDVGRAFQLAKSCATHLLEVGLPGAAAEAYEKALVYCGSAEDRLEILQGQALALYQCHNWKKVTATAKKARVIAHAVDPKHNVHDDLELMALRAEWANLELDRTLTKALVCLHAESASANHRLEAGSMALMLMDQVSPAHSSMSDIYELLERLKMEAGVTTAVQLRAAVVYHTSRGCLDTAVDSARAMVAEDRRSGNIGELFRSLFNAAITLRTVGLFREAEAGLVEALSVAERHKMDHAVHRVLYALANLALSRGLTADVSRWLMMLRRHPCKLYEKITALEMRSIGARLALLQNRPLEAKRLGPQLISDVARIPVVYRRTYSAALYVAIELANRAVPSSASLQVLLDAHLLSRRAINQEFAAYTLYVGLRAVGENQKGEELLEEYLTTYRRESYPAPVHLLDALERSLVC